ncbi:MAG: hypothetical protein ACLGJB_06435 [Blastocatellia bacterium]
MKRASLITLALASVFAAACGVDSESNRGAGNVNKNAASNSNAGGAQGVRAESITAGDPSVITIAVVVCYDANRAVQVRVTEPMYVSAKNQQKVRWCVYNDLDVPLTSVSVSAFNGGGSAPASLCSNTPNLTTGQIPPGNLDAACTEFCATAVSAAGTSFQYTVTARPEGEKEVNALGPRVIIQ